MLGPVRAMSSTPHRLSRRKPTVADPALQLIPSTLIASYLKSASGFATACTNAANSSASNSPS
jgi:hypothetical protein